MNKSQREITSLELQHTDLEPVNYNMYISWFKKKIKKKIPACSRLNEQQHKQWGSYRTSGRMAGSRSRQQTHSDYVSKKIIVPCRSFIRQTIPRYCGGIIVMTTFVLRFHFRIYWIESGIRSSSILIGWYHILLPRIYIAIQLSPEPPAVHHSSVPASPRTCQSCKQSGTATCTARHTAVGKSRAGPGTCVAQSPSVPLLNSSMHFRCLVPS